MKYRKVIHTKLPKGYFYEGKFLTPYQTLKELVKDKIIEIIHYENGPYEYKEELYPKLSELYNAYEKEFNLPYSVFVRRYESFGVKHIIDYAQGYVYTKEENPCVYFNYEELINDICKKFSFITLASSEEFEKKYIEHNEAHYLDYFEHTVKERIGILEEWKGCRL